MDIPELDTERLTLGRLEESDLPRVAGLAGDRDVARNTESIPHPYSEEDARDFLEIVREAASEGTGCVFAIRFGESGDLIGAVGVHPEPEHGRAWLGYWIGKPYWNRGYATEATRRAVKWAFEEQATVEIERLYAETFARNGASCRMVEKVGMKEEGHLRRHFRKWDEYVDVKVYGLLREGWKK